MPAVCGHPAARFSANQVVVRECAQVRFELGGCAQQRQIAPPSAVNDESVFALPKDVAQIRPSFIRRPPQNWGKTARLFCNAGSL